MPQMLTAVQAGKLYNVTATAIRNWIRDGSLPAVKSTTGYKSLLVTREDLVRRMGYEPPPSATSTLVEASHVKWEAKLKGRKG